MEVYLNTPIDPDTIDDCTKAEFEGGVMNITSSTETITRHDTDGFVQVSDAPFITIFDTLTVKVLSDVDTAKQLSDSTIEVEFKNGEIKNIQGNIIGAYTIRNHIGK